MFNADSHRLHTDIRRYYDDNLRKSVFDLRKSALR